MPALIVFLLGVLAYLPAISCGFIWDDESYVVTNAVLRDGQGLWRIWTEPTSTPQYYPLVHTTFWIEYQAWQLWSSGYHAVNIVLHAMTAVLVLIALRRFAVPGAMLAAAVFALHPVHVESVAWITERKNVLSGLFYMLAVLAWLRFWPLEQPRQKGNHQAAIRWRWYAATWALFVCALLSKTVTASLPAALALLMWWKCRLTRKAALLLAPMLLVGAAMGLMTAHLEKVHVGADGQDWALSGVERALVAGRALWFYAGKLVAPHKLTFIYPRWHVSQAVWWQYLFPAAALATIGALWALRRKLGRGPLVAVLFFAGSLLPALGFVDVYPFRFSFVADHFQYLASLGLIVLFSASAATLLRRLRLPRRATLTAAGAVVSVLATLTVIQCCMYRDVETLWLATVERNPKAWMAWTNLGGHYTLQVRLAHDRLDFDSANANLDKATAAFERAVEVNPACYDAWQGLGVSYLLRKQAEPARRYLRHALSICDEPNKRQALYNLACASLLGGDAVEAVDLLEQVVRLDADYYDAHYYLAGAYRMQCRYQEAKEHLRHCCRIAPEKDEAFVSLVWLLATSPDHQDCDVREAINLASAAVRSTHWQDPVAIDLLAAAQAADGQFDAAARNARRAVELASARQQTDLAEQIALRAELYAGGTPVVLPLTSE